MGRPTKLADDQKAEVLKLGLTAVDRLLTSLSETTRVTKLKRGEIFDSVNIDGKDAANRITIEKIKEVLRRA